MARNHYSSEKAIYLFFNKNLMAYKPISFYSECLQNIPVLILYGDRDWSPVDQGKELVSLLGKNSKVDFVSDSGHMLSSDNFEELSSKILEFTLSHEDSESKDNCPVDFKTSGYIESVEILDENYEKHNLSSESDSTLATISSPAEEVFA